MDTTSMDHKSQGIGELTVSSYTDVVGPQTPMHGPLADGGVIIAHTVPGCWGPMITPELRGGHEVTQPVGVVGAEVGDALALSIRRISIRSGAASSGVDAMVEGRFRGDPSVAAVCPQCGRPNPGSYLKGIGLQAVRCRDCDAEVAPFTAPNGYTMVFDQERTVGVTVDSVTAERIARSHAEYAHIPPNARQHSALVMALGDLTGVLARVRPMVGNLGTSPGIPMPASRNAGDVGRCLVGAPHDLAISEEQLTLRTDAHMDVDTVGEGTVVVCPVKVPGGGVYLGDVHAMQGDGETAGHTTDVAAEVVLQVSVVKDLVIDGPILLPRAQDLPPQARPYTAGELAHADNLARALGVALEAPLVPVQVVGTGADLMDAVSNGIHRLAGLAGMGRDEVRNRVTITGAIEIGRLPGVVQVTALLPLSRLDRLGLGPLYRRQYLP